MRELLDDQDRQARRRDAAHVLVELLDDERREPHRQLVEQQHRGSVASARAIASICCSPPDSVPAVCLRRSRRRGNCANARSCTSLEATRR